MPPEGLEAVTKPGGAGPGEPPEEPADAIDYPERMREAMRRMVRDLLAEVAEDGLPGDHHFLLTIRTASPGVVLSETLRARYPRELSVVLQHQFWDLEVKEESFGVTLKFGGVPERLEVPYRALAAFVDPHAEFGLPLISPDEADAMEEAPLPAENGGGTVGEPTDDDPTVGETTGRVLPFGTRRGE